MKKVSIIVPCYNEEKQIENFYNEIIKIFKEIKQYDFEIIYVVDPSSDNSFDIIRNLNKKDKRVRYIFMTNRFGKEACMYAGFKMSSGDLICSVDVDMQDPIYLLKDMINYINEGYDSVAVRRTTRKNEPFLRSIFSNLFYKIMLKTSKLDMQPGDRDFRLMSRKMLDACLLSKEKNRFLKAIYGFTGFKTKWLEYENIERIGGKTKWSFFGLFSYAMTCIFGFTNVPLLVVNFIGFLLFIISIIIFMFIIIYNCILGNALNNTFLIFNIIMFFTGVQVMCMGILCEYLYSIYIEVKDKPLYIILETEKDNN